jgi:hypothetical protein
MTKRQAVTKSVVVSPTTTVVVGCVGECAAWSSGSVDDGNWSPLVELIYRETSFKAKALLKAGGKSRLVTNIQK